MTQTQDKVVVNETEDCSCVIMSLVLSEESIQRNLRSKGKTPLLLLMESWNVLDSLLL